MLSNSKTRRAGSDSLLLRIPTPEALPITCTSPSFTDDVWTRKGSDACPAEVGRSQRQASRALSRRRAMCMPRVMLLSVRRVLAGGEEGVHGSGIAVRSPVQAICCRLAAASEQPCSLVPGPCLSSPLVPSVADRSMWSASSCLHRADVANDASIFSTFIPSRYSARVLCSRAAVAFEHLLLFEGDAWCTVYSCA